MSGDVKVLGLVGGTHIIEDLGIDVPHGATVTIPAAKAHVSKDLWRAISQRCVFQLQSGPAAAVARSSEHVEVESLRAQVRVLVEENARLQAALKTREAESQTKLDTILGLLRAGVPMAGVAATLQERAAPQATEAVSGDAPMFIPSQIKPENVEVQIATTATESAGEGVGNAASALRKLRKGSGQ